MTTSWADLELPVPVVQAPVGSAATPALAAAVSQAGALGTLALSWTDPARVARQVQRTAALTARPFGVNLVLAWPQAERLAACLDVGVRVVSTSWGDPAPYRAAVAAAGAVHVHMVGSVEQARRAADAGVDAVVAQGWEAGGHVLGEVGTLALVPAVVDVVAPVPVLAAGGIADGRGVAAALALGAAGAWVGTRFLLAAEADAPEGWVERLLAADEGSTVHGVVFDGGWAGAPHRVLRTATTDAWVAAGRPAGPHRPGEGDVVGTFPDGTQVRRYSQVPPSGALAGDAEDLALYAGQGVGLARRRQPAAEIVAELADGLAATLARLRATGDRTGSGPAP